MDGMGSAIMPVNRIYGVVIGIVVDNKDPEGLYRIKVKFPWVRESDSRYTNAADDGDFLSTWARMATFLAGNDRGAYWLPEVDDEVLVAFEHGDVRRPYVIGSLWNKVDKAVHDNLGGKNDFRSIVSRCGHVVQLIDEAGHERIVIQTKGAAGGNAAKDHASRDGHYIVLDHSGGAEKIEIYDRKQENYVLIDSTNQQITVKSANGDILLSAPNGSVKIECRTLETCSTSTTKIAATGAMTVQTQASMDTKAGSTMTIQGSQVKIN
jgi:uncharacterized protein involved in type VI secretion and phage assembly